METDAQTVRVAVVDGPLDPAAAYDAVGDPAAGAVAVFVGTVRDHSEDHQGVTHLEYETYDEHIGESIRRIVDEARARWPVIAVVVEHRVGRVELGEPAVVVAVSTAHRHDALQAAAYLIDEVKARAPLWKKEYWPGGAEWVEGA